jgi:hypothetical protein
MESSENRHPCALPSGSIEPHALLLECPDDDCRLYKIMTVENLLRSITGNYLHFNRVDAYEDFPDADRNDGRQLPVDQPLNAEVKFATSRDFSAADYYDQCRSRTYACCFSVENSTYIWETYGKGSRLGKVCLVFELGKLKAMLNAAVNSTSSALLYEGKLCHQIFSVNYGLVKYVSWSCHQANTTSLPNPVIYTYLKDAEKFSKEKEFRVSLSAIGIGQFALADNSLIAFHPALELAFDFRNAVANGTIKEILVESASISEILGRALSTLRIIPKADSSAS